jgi:hypothetical protein
MIQLPIGLDFHTISNEQTHGWKLPNESHLPGAQEFTFVSIKENFTQKNQAKPNQVKLVSFENDDSPIKPNPIKNLKPFRVYELAKEK